MEPVMTEELVMGTVESITTDFTPEFIVAFCKARLAVPPIPKSAKNPFFKSNYAPLDVVIDYVYPCFLNEEIAILQYLELLEDGKQEILVTQMIHPSGGNIKSCYLVPTEKDPQKKGIQITYGRRYSLLLLAGVSADDDTDGNMSPPPKPAPAHITATQLRELGAVLDKEGYTADMKAGLAEKLGVASATKILQADFASVLKKVVNPEFKQCLTTNS